MHDPGKPVQGTLIKKESRSDEDWGQFSQGDTRILVATNLLILPRAP